MGVISGGRAPPTYWRRWEAPWALVTCCVILLKVRQSAAATAYPLCKDNADTCRAVFNNNGLQWFIPYLVAITLLAIPVLILEVSLGQAFRGYASSHDPPISSALVY